MQNPIAAVVITLNEENNIEGCIRALQQVCKQVIVVDSESTDRTVRIARDLGAEVFVKPWEGYGAAKNFGNEQASVDWIVSVDADEFLSEELISSLNALKPIDGHVYMVNVLPNYCGIWIRHGNWHPDWNVRIFNRKEVKWNEDEVHEQLIGIPMNSKIKVNGPLLHYSYRTEEEHEQKIEYYAELGAKKMIANGDKLGVIKQLFGPIFRFLKGFILKLGILDGKMGWTIARKEALLVKKRNAYFKKLSQ